MLETIYSSRAVSDAAIPFLDARLPVGIDKYHARDKADAIPVFAANAEFQPLSAALAEQGYAASAAPLRRSGVEAVIADGPPLVISDMATPGFSGFDLVRDLRAGGYQGRIFALVDRGDVLTSVIALEMGADLVIEKPVQDRLLCSYIKKALQDRAAVGDQGRAGVLRFGRLTIDLRGRHVSCGDTSLDLSGQHFDLLELLARHAGRHVSREQVIESLGGYPGLNPRSVDCMVYRLRKRLAEHGICGVTTVRGRGYLFAPRNW